MLPPRAKRCVGKAQAKACHRWRITLADLEALLLPPWNFNCAFRDRRSFFKYIGRAWEPQVDEVGDSEGELTEWEAQTPESASPASSAAPSRGRPRKRPRTAAARAAARAAAGGSDTCLGRVYGVHFPGPGGLTYYSARWVELLDGTTLARLMTDAHPTEVVSGIDSHFAQVALESLRRVSWAPAHHWVFPRPCRDRMVFLSWVGRELGLNPTWTQALWRPERLNKAECIPAAAHVPCAGGAAVLAHRRRRRLGPGQGLCRLRAYRRVDGGGRC